MKLTLNLLQASSPELKTPEALLEPLQKTFDKIQVNTPNRVACFLAQVAHESGGFNYRVENLNYSKEGLLKTFPKYFDNVTASKYARKKEAIASRVYANRMGNGAEASRDGWTYRGAGFIMLTGKNNHERFAKFLDMSLADELIYIQTLEGACMSAGWFWSVTAGGLNATCDAFQPKKITMLSEKQTDNPYYDKQCKLINGGTIGMKDRVNRYNRIIQAF